MTAATAPKNDYFALDQLIVERLTERLGSDVAVKVAPEMSEAQFKSLTKPTAVVVFERDELLQAVERTLRTRQSWCIYLVYKGATSNRKSEAGETFYKILEALQGWEPGLPGAVGAMQYEGADTEYDSGVHTYAIFLSLELTTKLGGGRTDLLGNPID